MSNIDFSLFDVSKGSDGLVPAVIQDDVTLRVLMVGYMDREALERTLESGRVTFFSRTKQRLWTKGETSGNYLDVVSVMTDCDNDTLLIRVRPHGPACHNGTVSCFTDTLNTVGESRPAGDADAEGFIRRLGDVIRRRHAEMPDGSYTTKLFTKGVNKIAQKVGEEAVETVIEAVAGNRDAFLYEASDLVYHLLVLLEQMNCSITDIEHELKSRHK
ncbi:MAG: bifunctional phosphoribosyl-AMP cyclohydrolase/phosphoribosyl-ATP diphosphatase HisIE [Alistipes sp.]|nr:bifunctional phosphoribosyl-AMP cyclohydrolase/phosphoribosyl-ATP diphosphatase HisIE [Alistipes sp.]